MKNYQKRSTFLLLFGLLSNIYSVYSQNSNDISIYNWFDKTVGKENLDINNGTPLINPYKTIGGNNMYYIEDKYELGNLIYDGQIYYNAKLKYNIYNDILALNPPGESENTGINLITSKVESFSIKNIPFVRIEHKANQIPEFASGYYEQNVISSDLIFYIKHHKTAQKNINDAGIYYKFDENNLFFLDYKNIIYQIRSKNDIIKLFPEQKKQINGFYLMNRELKKADLNQFMKNLMKYISNSLSIQTK